MGERCHLWATILSLGMPCFGQQSPFISSTGPHFIQVSAEAEQNKLSARGGSSLIGTVAGDFAPFDVFLGSFHLIGAALLREIHA